MDNYSNKPFDNRHATLVGHHNRSTDERSSDNSQQSSTSFFSFVKSFFGQGKTGSDPRNETKKKTANNFSVERDALRNELEKARKQCKMQEEVQFELERKIASKEADIQILESKISSLQKDKNRALHTEEDLKRKLKNLEEERDTKEHDLSAYAREAAVANSQLQDRDDHIAHVTNEFHETNTKVVQITEERKHFEDEIAKLRQQIDEDYRQFRCQEREMSTRVETLQKDLNEKDKELDTLRDRLMTKERELQQKNEHTGEPTEEVVKMKINETKLRRKITLLEEDKERLTEQTEDMARRFEKEKAEKETGSRKEDGVLTSRIKDMEQTIKEFKEKLGKLATENQNTKTEKERLKEEKSVLEAQDMSNKKDNTDLRVKMAALQASSETREKMLQKEVEKLTQQHAIDIREQEERHASEKEDMQTQMEKFLHVLNDQKNVERDTIRATIQQVAHTSAVTNQFLQAAFRTYQRRQHAAANIREVDDDL